MPLSLGDRLGPYEIIALLGAGGMGEVYKGRDTRLGRDVAIKVLPESFTTPIARERFLREARACSALSHPNICAIYDLGDSGDRQYLVMELLEGETLRQQIKAKRLDVQQALEFAIQLTRALETAHTKGIIHRDIKPANVIITPQGQLKVLDFGLAKISVASPAPRGDETETAPMDDLTVAGTPLGTYAYMSPEQARGGVVDARSDIWSVGVLLYEMVTGSQPFTGPTAAVILERACTARPDPLRPRSPKATPELERIIFKALDKDVDRRYQKASELRSDLERAGRGMSASVRLPGRRAALVSLAVLAVAAGGVFWMRQTAAPRASTESLAVLPFLNLSSDKDQEYFSDGLAEELLNGLSRVPNLRVTGRTSSFQFRGKTEDPRSIGKKLNVAMLLEGSVRKQGSRVRVTARLIKAADGFQVWSQVYDRELNDILAVQEEIALAVTGALEVTLLRSTPAQWGGTKNPEAYNAFLEARYYSHMRSKEGLEKAAAYYEQATRLDPHYSLAWVMLGSVRANQAGKAEIPLDEGYRMAREYVNRALALDPNLGMAHAVMGWIQETYDWDWAAADVSLKRALALEPGNVTVIENAASLDKTLGRFDEAIGLLRQAIAIDPLDADPYYNLALTSYHGGRMEEAAAAARKVSQLAPNYSAAHTALAMIYLAQSRPQEALEEVQREKNPAWRLIGFPAVYHALGREKEADAALAELVAKLPMDAAYQIAEMNAYLGKVDSAFQWLDRAYAQRDGGLTEIKGEPLLKSLERDPRYAEFLKKMRL